MKEKFFILIIAIGFGLVYLSVNQYMEVFPFVDFDMVRITTTSSELDSQKLEDSVTIRLENEIKKIDGIKTILSTTIPGRSEIRMERKEDSQSDFFDEVNNIIPQLGLPKSAQTEVVKVTTDNSPILEIFIKQNSEKSIDLKETCYELKNRIDKTIINLAISECDSKPIRVNGFQASTLRIFPIPKKGISVIKKIKEELNPYKERYGLMYYRDLSKFTDNNINILLKVLLGFLVISGLVGYYKNHRVLPLFFTTVIGIIVLSHVVLKFLGQSVNLLTIYSTIYFMPLVFVLCFYFIFTKNPNNKITELKRGKLLLVGIILVIGLLLLIPFGTINSIFGKFIFDAVKFSVILFLSTGFFIFIIYELTDNGIIPIKNKNAGIYNLILNFFTKNGAWVGLFVILPFLFFGLTMYLVISQGKFQLFPKGTDYRIKLIAKPNSDPSVIEKEILNIENQLKKQEQNIEFMISSLGEISKDENDPFALYGKQFGQIKVHFYPMSTEKIKLLTSEIAENLKSNNPDIQLEWENSFTPINKPILFELNGEERKILEEVSQTYLNELSFIRGVIKPKISFSEYGSLALRRKNFKPMIEVVADLDESIITKSRVDEQMKPLENNLAKGVVVGKGDNLENDKSMISFTRYLIIIGIIILGIFIFMSYYFKNILPFLFGIFLPIFLFPNAFIVSVFFKEYNTVFSIFSLASNLLVVYLGFLILLGNIRKFNSVIDGAVESISTNVLIPIGFSIVSILLYFVYKESSDNVNSFFLSLAGILLYQSVLLGVIFPVLFNFIPFGLVRKNDVNLAK